MEDTPAPSTPGVPAKLRLGWGKILVGALLIVSQLIRPGLGFYVGSENSNELLTPASNEVLGYDLFAVFVYCLGLFLIWRGARR
jgi:hypothetical protein